MTPLDLEQASQSSSWLISTYTPFYRQDCHWVSIIARGQRLTLASYLRSSGTSDDQSYVYIGIPTGNGTARHSISSSSSICTGYRHTYMLQFATSCRCSVLFYTYFAGFCLAYIYLNFSLPTSQPLFVCWLCANYPCHQTNRIYMATGY